jgi:hypothetical protein
VREIDKPRAWHYLHAFFRTGAQVAELVDALDSGSSGRKVVEVRVFSWAPIDLIRGPAWSRNSRAGSA